MAQGNRAAIDIGSLVGQTQFIHYRQSLHGKSLVEFNQVQIGYD